MARGPQVALSSGWREELPGEQPTSAGHLENLARGARCLPSQACRGLLLREGGKTVLEAGAQSGECL